MCYKQLTLKERYYISVLLKTGLNRREIDQAKGGPCGLILLLEAVQNGGITQ